MFGIGKVNTPIVPCTKEMFDKAVDSEEVKRLCDVIAEAERKMAESTRQADIDRCKKVITHNKKLLPCITPMAWFKDNKRGNRNARPSGLNMLDIDHISVNNEQLTVNNYDYHARAEWLLHSACDWDNVAQDIKDRIVCIHMTPSTQGLRIIFVQPEGKSIAEAQAEMAHAMKVPYDNVTKDLARCSFLVPRSYFLYINNEKLFNGYGEVSAEGLGNPTTPASAEGAIDDSVVRKGYVSNGANPTSAMGAAHTNVAIGVGPSDLTTQHDNQNNGPYGPPYQVTSVPGSQATQGGRDVTLVPDSQTMEGSSNMSPVPGSQAEVITPSHLGEGREEGRGSQAEVTTPSHLGEGRGEGPDSSCFKGIPYSEIIKAVLFAASYDETPAEGERNNALYLLARNLRYVCDFDADRIIAILPDWGLSAKEVRLTVESAVKSVRKVIMPQQLQTILNNLSKQYNKPSEQGYSKEWDYVVEPEGIIGQIVDQQPTYLKNACYLACMACFGTLLTRLRGYGCDGSEIAPNMMLTISAPQASGKKFMRHVFNTICKPIKDEDKKQRKILNDIDKENKRHANDENYEEKDFEGAIRLLPANVSNRVLIERLDKAKFQHLMMMAEEIDSITKAEKTGKWSEKSDIYRYAYDNSEWGQDYANENAYNAIVPVYLNLLFSGTPAAVSRFFNDIENGLITRFLFCDLPDTFGMKRPKKKRVSESEQRELELRIQQIYDTMNQNHGEDGHIWMDTTQMVEDAEEYYDEVQRYAYLVNQDDVSRDLARRRYADYVVKFMMIETYLNGGVYTESIRDRAINMMNLCTEQLLAMHGDEINESLNESAEKHEKAKKRSQRVNVLELLKDEFTAGEYKLALNEIGGKVTCAGKYLERLVNGGVIEKIERGNYKKLIRPVRLKKSWI